MHYKSRTAQKSSDQTELLPAAHLSCLEASHGKERVQQESPELRCTLHFFIVLYLEQRQILIWFNTMRFPYSTTLPLRSGGDGQKSSPSTYTASVRSAMNTESNPQLKMKSAKAAMPQRPCVLGA